MSNVTLIDDDFCEVITKFAFHSLKVLYVPDHICFWYPSQTSCMLESRRGLLTLGVDGDMVDAQFIGTFLTA